MTLSPQQLAQRMEGATATDVAAILELHPYRTKIDVYADKLGIAQPFAGNERTKWGDILEGPIRNDYAERRGVRVEVPGTLTHPMIHWAMATPDGICYRPGQAYPDNGLEIKTHSFRAADQYGDQGTDEVPQHELIQCMWNMFVSGLEVWDLVAFVDGQPADYRIKRDDELIGLMADEAEKFLVDHVRKKVPPSADGSKSYDRYLSTRYPHRHKDFVNLDDKPEALMLVRSLRAELDKFSQAETSVEIIKQNLKAVIGDHSGLEWTDATRPKKKDHIYYRTSKDGSKTDWQASWRSLVTEAQLALSVDHKYDDDMEIISYRDALTNIADEKRSIELYTSTVSGTRRFNVPKWWSKNQNESTKD
jgi:putative phage-type endonuclease